MPEHGAAERAVRVEVCVDSPAGAQVAEGAGADRVELCCALIVGGLTPSIGAVTAALAGLDRVAVQVLIRPRDGDFVYDRGEIGVMVRDIEAVRRESTGAAVEVGFVIGALTEAGEVDRAVTAELVAACGGASTTFHRAFDLTEDLGHSLDTLIDLGVDRVLTAGGVQRAADGLPALAALVARGAGDISVMPGGSVRPANVAGIVAATGAREVHFRAAAARANARPPRSPQVRMAATDPPDEAARSQTSPELVARMLRALGR